MTRKEFLARASALFGTLTVTSLSGSPASGSPVHGRGKVEALNKLVSERHKARWRFRRIILNNDGNDVILSEGEIVSREMFLAKPQSSRVFKRLTSCLKDLLISFSSLYVLRLYLCPYCGT